MFWLPSPPTLIFFLMFSDGKALSLKIFEEIFLKFRKLNIRTADIFSFWIIREKLQLPAHRFFSKVATASPMLTK